MARRAARPAQSHAGSTAGIWLIGLACGALVGFATAYALLAGVLLAPGLLLMLTDDAPGRPAGRAVLTIGAATLVQPALGLWAAGHQMASAVAVVTDPRGLAASWSLQGAGWLAIELGPTLLRLALDAAAHARALRLRHQRARLETDWGIPPPADAPDARFRGPV